MSRFPTIPTLTSNDPISLAESIDEAHGQVHAFFSDAPIDKFFSSVDGKWSLAQDIRHVERSISSMVFALSLPAPLLRLYFRKKPNRPSRAYQALIEKYHKALKGGVQAKGRYQPDAVRAESQTEKQKTELLQQFDKTAKRLTKRLLRWKNRRLDEAVVPHPALGWITLRELMYFAHYHALHHLHGAQNKMKQLGESA